MIIKNINFDNYYYCTNQDKDSIGSVIIGELKIIKGGNLTVDNVYVQGKGFSQSTIGSSSWGNGFYGNIIGKATASDNTQIDISNISTNVTHDGYAPSYAVDGGIVGLYEGTGHSSMLNISNCHVSDYVLAFSWFSYCQANGGGG